VDALGRHHPYHDVTMTSRVRTQVYLDRDEHRRLTRLAAERDVSMTELVREAVGRYLTTAAPVPGVGEDDLPAGADALVERMRARRATAVRGPSSLEGDDAEVADLLARKLGEEE
jgi:hypothetical protein